MSRYPPFDVIRGVLLANWGTKATAVVLALVVFIMTRDEIHRTFTLPLRVVQDPNRVLLTSVPEVVNVEIRGPWPRLNRMSTQQLGAATLKLAEAHEGPLEIDPASIVMPSGVILERIDYDQVDLRFDPVIEREVAIVPRVVGEVSGDYELVSVEVNPQVWTVRGGEGEMSQIQELSTTSINVGGATATIETYLDVVAPDAVVRLEGVVEGAPARVEVRARVRARTGTSQLTVPILAKIAAEVPELDPARDGIPQDEKIVLRGPQWALHALDEIERPVVPVIRVDRKADKTAIELRFGWAEQVPANVQAALTPEPSVVRFSVERDREL